MIDGGLEVSDLVRTLITGFFTSIILLFLVYCFWKLYDRPSKRQIELQEEKREKRKEERMWKNIEAEMAKEQEQAEALATIERKKAEMRARAQPPAAGIMQNALATLDSPTEGEEFLERFKPNVSEIEEILVEEELETEEVDDSDVLLAPDLVEVRQDEGSTDIDLLDQLTEDEDEASDEADESLVEESSIEESTETEAETKSDEAVDWNKTDESEEDGWAVGW